MSRPPSVSGSQIAAELPAPLECNNLDHFLLSSQDEEEQKQMVRRRKAIQQAGSCSKKVTNSRTRPDRTAGAADHLQKPDAALQAQPAGVSAKAQSPTGEGSSNYNLERTSSQIRIPAECRGPGQ